MVWNSYLFEIESCKEQGVGIPLSASQVTPQPINTKWWWSPSFYFWRPWYSTRWNTQFNEIFVRECCKTNIVFCRTKKSIFDPLVDKSFSKFNPGNLKLISFSWFSFSAFTSEIYATHIEYFRLAGLSNTSFFLIGWEIDYQLEFEHSLPETIFGSGLPLRRWRKYGSTGRPAS